MFSVLLTGLRLVEGKDQCLNHLYVQYEGPFYHLMSRASHSGDPPLEHKHP
jgi:hypothetical protein